MELEILVDAPNGEDDREKIYKMFQEQGYCVLSLTLKEFQQSKKYYFQVMVEQNDSFKQD